MEGAPEGEGGALRCPECGREVRSARALLRADLVGELRSTKVRILAVHRLRRYEPRWQQLSESMLARGKPVSVIIGAVANRWLRGLYHQMKGLPMAG